MKTQRAVPFAALLFAFLAPAACTEGGATGPQVPPPPPGPAPDVIQTVTVAITGLEITGSCDHDNIFESSGDGEFTFVFEVTPSGSQTTTVWSVSQTYSEGSHDTGGQAAVFNRNVTRGEDFGVRFVGTEFDGLLGADGQFNGRFNGRSHNYSGGSWDAASGTRTLTGGKPMCGAELTYSITSVDAG